jgi:hypothetical protein
MTENADNIAEQFLDSRTIRTLRAGPSARDHLIYELDGRRWRWRQPEGVKADIRNLLINAGTVPTEDGVRDVLKAVHRLTLVDWPRANSFKALEKILGNLADVPLDRMELRSKGKGPRQDS